MLTTLRIRNLALVSDLTLELHPGLNVVTGETGAGKSVILGAIQLVLGERADRSAIRAGTDLCSVEAVFTTGHTQTAIDTLLTEHGLDPCSEGVLVLRRSFTPAGTNRQFINGSPTTLTTLAALGNLLVDLHGPHEHQSLLQPARQLAILDAFGGLTTERTALALLVRERSDWVAQKAALIGDEQSYARQLDLLRYQTQEIESARLQPGEEESLSDEHRRLANAARLLELSQSAATALAHDDDSISQRLATVGRLLHDLVRIDPGTEPLSSLHEQVVSLLRDLQHGLDRYTNNTELDPERLQTVTERLNLVQSLRRKYGSTVEDILQFGRKARAQLETLESRDSEILRLDQALHELDGRIEHSARSLHNKRRKIAPSLAKAASRELASLGFRQAGFSAEIEIVADRDNPESATADGYDRCEFLFAPNPGEPARPLRSIASSGELARVMLALKTALAEQDEVPVLIFDEVDANVGGETAHAVGINMQRIAQNHQVLCITHLAPVAAHATTHFVVSKEVIDGRTESRIQPVTDQGRVEEIGRMLGGGTAACRHAKELLASATAALK